MAKFCLFASICCVILGFICSDTPIQFGITPRYVDLYRTESLVVNCTFSYDAVSSMSSLLSLTIAKRDSHNDSDSGFQTLATINAFTPDQVDVKNPGRAQFFGGIDANGISSLGFRWTSPTEAESGLYRCNAVGVDRFGQPVDISHMSLVTAETLEAGQLLETIKDQQTQIDTISQLLLSVSDLVNKLTAIEYSLNNLTTYVNSSLDSIESRLNDLEKLSEKNTSLTLF